ncbi:three-helix bundle dimerization domain-containing protein [Allonocardiopsis opalescens]|uniref:Uncharacterized protein n=1 Tax=Allonocardiopsis opalescens TaxID=1144618 RepID=A0A2T0Q6V7_9ACTN|nr:hypothetical protein [Allonocardiopsis opalescens]PRX99521.1 hypothetical protein CLV72_103122 [Allonocardiopsis opalescens]
MSGTSQDTIREFTAIVDRLRTEFGGVHPHATVSRCVDAARHSVRDITGEASPDQVERIARKHLHVLALVAAEQR